VNCERCRGACCEEMSLPRHDVLPGLPPDETQWVTLHATPDGPGWLRFEVRCLALTTAGRCAVYTTRPRVCRDYEPGSTDCLTVVRRRRSAADYLVIRDESDPVTHQALPE
jgi:Fe-S-cluster containining protein